MIQMSPRIWYIKTMEREPRFAVGQVVTETETELDYTGTVEVIVEVDGNFSYMISGLTSWFDEGFLIPVLT